MARRLGGFVIPTHLINTKTIKASSIIIPIVRRTVSSLLYSSFSCLFSPSGFAQFDIWVVIMVLGQTASFIRNKFRHPELGPRNHKFITEKDCFIKRICRLGGDDASGLHPDFNHYVIGMPLSARLDHISAFGLPAGSEDLHESALSWLGHCADPGLR